MSAETISASPRGPAGGMLEDWELLCLHHPDGRLVGGRHPLSRAGISIGREEDCPSAMQHGSVSRRHTRIDPMGEGWLLRDQASRNGTWRNGQRVDCAGIENNDLIGIGDLLFLLRRVPRGWSAGRLPEGVVGWSVNLHEAVLGARRLGPRTAPVLVLGETGTGKEALARLLHEVSGRNGKLVAVNCGALGDGLLQAELFGHARGAFTGADRERGGLARAAKGGTLFLDELGEASAALQASLLRLVQEGEIRPVGSDETLKVELRLVAATHRDLSLEVAAGRFREDLFARLAVHTLRLPPLRERREDIVPVLLHALNRRVGRPVALGLRLAEQALLHPWPRNVREVESLAEQLVVSHPGATVFEEAGGLLLSPPLAQKADVVAASATPLKTPPVESAAEPEWSRRPAPELLRRRLTALGGSRSRLAAELSVGRTTLYRWLKEAGIEGEG